MASGGCNAGTRDDARRLVCTTTRERVGGVAGVVGKGRAGLKSGLSWQLMELNNPR